MSLTKCVLLAVLIAMHSPASAWAADPTALVGKWVEKFPSGTGLVTEFTSSTIVSYPIDKAGAPSDTPSKSSVTYRTISTTTIGVDFDGGGGITVEVENPDAIILEFPGIGAHQMTRM